MTYISISLIMRPDASNKFWLILSIDLYDKRSTFVPNVVTTGPLSIYIYNCYIFYSIAEEYGTCFISMF
jgi:hypothetical protein